MSVIRNLFIIVYTTYPLARVCNDKIEGFNLGQEFVGADANALQVGKIELDQFKPSAIICSVPSDLSGRRVRAG